MHEGSRPFLCDFCKKEFTTNSNLTRHKLLHTGKKPHKCDICYTTFSQSCHLNSHKRTHTGDRPYKCDVCDNAFSRISNLKRHRRKHTHEKPYQCNVCEKTFSDSSNLKQHKRIHSGEKPYQCDMCDMKFIRKGFMSRHIQIFHKNKVGGEPSSNCDDNIKVKIKKKSFDVKMNPLSVITQDNNNIKSDVMIKQENKGERIKVNLTTDHQIDIKEHGLNKWPAKDKITLANYRKFFNKKKIYGK